MVQVLSMTVSPEPFSSIKSGELSWEEVVLMLAVEGPGEEAVK